MAKNAVVVKFLADVDGLRKGVDSVDKRLGGLSKGLKTFAVGFAAAFSAEKVVEFAKQSVSAFSDFEEAASKVNVVFQEQSSIVERWSKKAVSDIGLSSQAALEAAGTFGNLFTAFGVGIPEAREMSITLTELASDLASFNNTSIDQALTALRSGLSGETEPLKRFGVALSQAAIETEALNLGLIEQGKELTAAAKSQAIYSLVMKQTTNAQGDFKRTQDGLANTQRTLNAAMEEAQRAIGEGLYNAITDLVQALGGPEMLADKVVEVGERTGLWVEGMLLLVGALEDGELAAKDYTRELDRLADKYEENGKGLKGVISILNDISSGTGTLPEVLAYTERRTKRVEEAMNNLENVKGPDHLSGELEETARKVRALEIEALSADRALRKLYLNNAQDAQLRVERQGDSFLRGFNDNDAAMRLAKEEARELAQVVDDVGRSTGGATKVIEENTKKVKGFGVEIGDWILNISKVGKKGGKITEEAVSAMTSAYQEFFAEISAEMSRAEAQLAETQQFIANATANLLGPTSLKAVQQQYGAAQTQAERLTREYERQLEAKTKLEQRLEGAKDDEKAGLEAQIKAAGDAANATKVLMDEQKALVDRGFVGFWEDAQKEVEQYQKKLQELSNFFSSDGIITETEAQIIKDLFSLPPDQGQKIIDDLLAQTDKTMSAITTQESLRTSTKQFVQGITDVFEGYGEFPALGYTNANKWVNDIEAYLRDPKTKRQIRKAAKSMLPKGLKIDVGWNLAPFPVSQFEPSQGSRSAAATVASIQEYERMNGTKWRDRVR